MLRKKQNIYSESDLKEAKNIYFRYGGNKFEMERDGVYKKYNNYGITKRQEGKWKDEIFEDYKSKIEKEYDNLKLENNIHGILMLEYRTTEAINIVIDILNRRDIDTFSSILICEEIKKTLKYTHENNNCDNVKSGLYQIKNKLLNEKITIDSRYLNASFMRDYDFSECSIRNRILNI